MARIARIISVVNMSRPAGYLSLTAIRMRTEDEETSMFFADSPKAATAQPGEWISFNEHNQEPTSDLQMLWMDPRLDALTATELTPEVVIMWAAGAVGRDAESVPHQEIEVAVDDIMAARAAYGTNQLPTSILVNALPVSLQNMLLRLRLVR